MLLTCIVFLPLDYLILQRAFTIPVNILFSSKISFSIFSCDPLCCNQGKYVLEDSVDYYGVKAFGKIVLSRSGSSHQLWVRDHEKTLRVSQIFVTYGKLKLLFQTSIILKFPSICTPTYIFWYKLGDTFKSASNKDYFWHWTTYYAVEHVKRVTCNFMLRK